LSCGPEQNSAVPAIIDRVVDRVDAVQRRHRVLGFPIAVFKRYGEDNGGWAGALIAYYGFFSLFPLLVVFVTVATWVLGDRPDLLQTVLEALWSRVPFAADLQTNVEEEVSTLRTNGWATVVSVLVLLWGSLGVARVIQDAVNRLWGVARFSRPGFLPKIARSLAIIALLGVGLIATAVVAGVTVTNQFPVVGLALVAVLNIAVGTAVTLAVYRLGIAQPVRYADLVPGAVVMAVGLYGLTLVASVYVKHVVARTAGIYGPFATTIGLLAYVSLLVQVFVYATEVNVVLARRLWPRSISGRALGEPDARAIDLTLRRERLLSQEQLTERGLTAEEAAAVAAGHLESPQATP
jgi:YihY family inner membrane protein